MSLDELHLPHAIFQQLAQCSLCLRPDSQSHSRIVGGTSDSHEGEDGVADEGHGAGAVVAEADGVAEGDAPRPGQVREPHPAPGVDVQVVHSRHEDKGQEEAIVPLQRHTAVKTWLSHPMLRPGCHEDTLDKLQMSVNAAFLQGRAVLPASSPAYTSKRHSNSSVDGLMTLPCSSRRAALGGLAKAPEDWGRAESQEAGPTLPMQLPKL